MFIIKYKKIFFAIAVLLITGSIVTMVIRGFNIGVDFTGGSVLEVSYETRPMSVEVKEKITVVQSDIELQEVDASGFIVRTQVIDQVQKDKILTAMSFDDFNATEKRFNTIGPTVGKQLQKKSIVSVIVVSLAIILFIAFAFRKVSKPISSWTYGLIAIAVLIHDVVIPAGFFALFGWQVDTLFVVGLLTILGVSINDTIVVFDRIRENLHTNETKHVHEEFSDTVGKSINQTFARSIMTSVTILIALAALYLFGPETTRTLSIAMFLGMFFGTYSSIFLASPLLVVWNNFRQKR